MSIYTNGKIFSLDFPFPLRHGLPYVNFQMSTDSKNFVEVIGVVNTAIRNPVLDFKTANALGIKKPKRGGEKQTVRTAINKRITCYSHMIMVRVRNSQGQSFEFFSFPGFAKKVKGNFFSMDLTRNFCLTFDRLRTHLLRD